MSKKTQKPQLDSSSLKPVCAYSIGHTYDQMATFITLNSSELPSGIVIIKNGMRTFLNQ